MDIKKEIASAQTLLIVVSPDKYNQLAVQTMKSLKGRICYVTLNKTYNALTETFKKNKIPLKNVIFIDAITKTVREVETQTDNCFCVSSPGALTELSLAITEFLKHEFDYIIFDSITNMMIYEKKGAVEKFLSSLVIKIKATKTKAIFYALPIKEQEEIIKDASLFVDKVISLNNHE